MRGHIKKRSENSWTLVLELGRDPATGKRRQKWITVRGTKKEAEKRLAEFIYEIENGLYVSPEKITVKEFFGQWIETYAKPNVRTNTLELYRGFIEKHIIPNLGSIRLCDLKPFHIQKLLSEKSTGGRADGKAGGMSARSVLLIYSILKEAFGHAVKWQLLARNPVDAVERPRHRKQPMETWLLEEALKFLSIAEQDRFYPLFVLAITTGMRRGELLALRWQDIDFERLVIYVRHTLSRRRTLEQTKTESSRRQVAISAKIAELLKQHRKRQIEERLKVGASYQDFGLVFCTEIGTPLNAENLVKRHFKPLIRKAGVKDIPFHGLRHCSATLALALNAHPKIIQERLGHSAITVTMDLYSHPTVDMQKEIAEKIEAVLLGKKNAGNDFRQ